MQSLWQSTSPPVNGEEIRNCSRIIATEEIRNCSRISAEFDYGECWCPVIARERENMHNRTQWVIFWQSFWFLFVCIFFTYIISGPEILSITSIHAFADPIGILIMAYSTHMELSLSCLPIPLPQKPSSGLVLKRFTEEFCWSMNSTTCS